MITTDKITEIFCAVDEFCKEFDKEIDKKSLMSSDGKRRRYRKASLSDSEIMTILIVFQFGSFRNFKHYYLFFIRQHLQTARGRWGGVTDSSFTSSATTGERSSRSASREPMWTTETPKYGLSWPRASMANSLPTGATSRQGSSTCSLRTEYTWLRVSGRT